MVLKRAWYFLYVNWSTSGCKYKAVLKGKAIFPPPNCHKSNKKSGTIFKNELSDYKMHNADRKMCLVVSNNGNMTQSLLIKVARKKEKINPDTKHDM